MYDPEASEILSAYLDDELSPEERAEVDRLLGESPEHRQLLEDLRWLRGRLRALPVREPASELTQRILRHAEHVAARQRGSSEAGGDTRVSPAGPSAGQPAGQPAGLNPHSHHGTSGWTRLAAVCAALAASLLLAVLVWQGSGGQLRENLLRSVADLRRTDDAADRVESAAVPAPGSPTGQAGTGQALMGQAEMGLAEESPGESAEREAAVADEPASAAGQAYFDGSRAVRDQRGELAKGSIRGKANELARTEGLLPERRSLSELQPNAFGGASRQPATGMGGGGGGGTLPPGRPASPGLDAPLGLNADDSAAAGSAPAPGVSSAKQDGLRRMRRPSTLAPGDRTPGAPEMPGAGRQAGGASLADPFAPDPSAPARSAPGRAAPAQAAPAADQPLEQALRGAAGLAYSRSDGVDGSRADFANGIQLHADQVHVLEVAALRPEQFGESLQRNGIVLANGDASNAKRRQGEQQELSGPTGATAGYLIVANGAQINGLLTELGSRDDYGRLQPVSPAVANQWLRTLDAGRLAGLGDVLPKSAPSGLPAAAARSQPMAERPAEGERRDLSADAEPQADLAGRSRQATPGAKSASPSSADRPAAESASTDPSADSPSLADKSATPFGVEPGRAYRVGAWAGDELRFSPLAEGGAGGTRGLARPERSVEREGAGPVARPDIAANPDDKPSPDSKPSPAARASLEEKDKVETADRAERAGSGSIRKSQAAPGVDSRLARYRILLLLKPAERPAGNIEGSVDGPPAANPAPR